MAFLDKLSQVGKVIGDKTGDAIEITKQTTKMRTERSAAAEDLQKIGEFYYNVFAANGAVAPEVLELCQSAAAHYAAANEAQAEIDRIKAESEAAAAPAAAPAAPAPAPAPAPAAPTVFCGACGAPNVAGTNFCGSCGAKL